MLREIIERLNSSFNAYATAQLGKEKLFKALEDDEVREYVRKATYRLGTEPAGVRWAVALSPDTSVETLVKLLYDGVSHIRLAAAEALLQRAPGCTERLTRGVEIALRKEEERSVRDTLLRLPYPRIHIHVGYLLDNEDRPAAAAGLVRRLDELADMRYLWVWGIIYAALPGERGFIRSHEFVRRAWRRGLVVIPPLELE